MVLCTKNSFPSDYIHPSTLHEKTFLLHAKQTVRGGTSMQKFHPLYIIIFRETKSCVSLTKIELQTLILSQDLILREDTKKCISRHNFLQNRSIGPLTSDQFTSSHFYLLTLFLTLSKKTFLPFSGDGRQENCTWQGKGKVKDGKLIRHKSHSQCSEVFLSLLIFLTGKFLGWKFNIFNHLLQPNFTFLCFNLSSIFFKMNPKNISTFLMEGRGL